MELRDGMFAVKLCELEHQYGLLRSRLELCQGADHEKIRHLLADVLDDYRENALLLEQSAEGCRSPAVAELAGVQRMTVCCCVSPTKKTRPYWKKW